MTQPDPGSIYRISAQLPLSVQRVPVVVSVNDPRVVRTDVLLDGVQVLAQFTGPAYNGFWSLQPGEHSFTARAYLRDGTHVDSTPVTIHVEQ